MLKQYKLRFYNFRLVVFLLAISMIGVTLVGTAASDLKSKQFVGVPTVQPDGSVSDPLHFSLQSYRRLY